VRILITINKKRPRAAIDRARRNADMFQTFPFKTPSIHFGLGAVSLLGKEVQKLGGKKVMVITGPSVKKAGMLDSVMASLEGSGH
jgi:alcohol dehydrogenase YqhD (iron-dependent ADH family)